MDPYEWLLKRVEVPMKHARLRMMIDAGRNNHLWSVHYGEQAYIFKHHESHSYEHPESLIYEWRLLKRLSEASLSFSVPLPLVWDRIEKQIGTAQEYLSLMTYFPGQRVNASDLSQVELFGSALGELQTALAHHRITSRPGRPLFESLFDFSTSDICALTPRTLTFAATPAMSALVTWWNEEAAATKIFAETRYRSLPQQICHNDFTPNNVLIDNERVSAVLDFEFMCPAARALDVAMALRTTMRIWENPEPWPVVEHFFRGYRRWSQLTDAEIEALPWLLRLRASLPIVWWIGRQRGLDRVPELIENLRTLVTWLSQYENRFLEVVRHSNQGH